MSKEMRDFAQFFMQGMQMGAGWAEKWQAQQIANERNRLTAARNAAVDRRENAKLALYGQDVMSRGEVNKARAFRIMNPVPKGGGGGRGKADPLANPGLDALKAKWAARTGFVMPDKATPGGNVVNNYNMSGDDSDLGGDAGSATYPGTETIQTDRKGGMVRKMAGGGSIEEGADMSIEEALAYGKSKSKGSAFGNAAASAAGKVKYKGKTEPWDKLGGSEKAINVGPVGSGADGMYTTADVQPGGVLYQGFEEGGRVGRQPNRRTMDSDFKVGRGKASVRGDYSGNEQVLDLEAGYEYPVGRNTTLGIQGNYNKYVGPGGEHERPDFGVGVRGRMRFQEGGVAGNAVGGAGVPPDLTQPFDPRKAYTEAMQRMATFEQQQQQTSGKNTPGYSGSADGATGDSSGGTGEAGSVGAGVGTAVGAAGATAAADADAAAAAAEGGAGTHARGGRVRRFQSGGRVMEAIDTGTSGPGSGYGYRAAPPARRY